MLFQANGKLSIAHATMEPLRQFLGLVFHRVVPISSFHRWQWSVQMVRLDLNVMSKTSTSSSDTAFWWPRSYLVLRELLSGLHVSATW